MLKSVAMVVTSLVMVSPAFADLKIPLLEKKACAARIDKDLVARYAGQPYGYAGGGFITSIKATANVYSIIGFTTPGMGDAEDEVVVLNQDCSVLSNTTISAE